MTLTACPPGQEEDTCMSYEEEDTCLDSNRHEGGRYVSEGGGYMHAI